MVENEWKEKQTFDNEKTYSVRRGGEEIITNFGTGNLYTILQSGKDETVQ